MSVETAGRAMEAETEEITFSDALSLSTTRIVLCRKLDDGRFVDGATATGFFWTSDDSLVLVTSRHNMTGWDELRGKALNANGFTPTHLRVPYLLKADVDPPRAIRRVGLVELYDTNGIGNWLEHSSYNQVDVAVARILDIKQQQFPLLSQPVNTYQFQDYEVNVADDAYVIGYPKNMDGGAGLPIWKRASIATEPRMNLDRLPNTKSLRG